MPSCGRPLADLAFIDARLQAEVEVVEGFHIREVRQRHPGAEITGPLPLQLTGPPRNWKHRVCCQSVSPDIGGSRRLRPYPANLRDSGR